jgi:hypothetical protein
LFYYFTFLKKNVEGFVQYEQRALFWCPRRVGSGVGDSYRLLAVPDE